MIILEEVTKTYQRAQGGGEVQALGRISTSIKGGEFVALVGPSGCGKSTLLEAINLALSGQVNGRPI